MRIAYRFRHC